MGFSLSSVSCHMARICISRNPEEKQWIGSASQRKKEKKRKKQRRRVTEFEGQQTYVSTYFYICNIVYVREREERNGKAESLIIGVTGSSKVNESWA